MDYTALYTSKTFFGGVQKEIDEADYVIIGVPLDITGTYRSGSKFAPSSIREASLNIETYSFRSNIDLEDIRIHDLGDIDLTGDINENIKRIELVVGEVLRMNKTAVLIGGEHTLTLGAAKNLKGEAALISFDAHLDLRERFMNLTVSHATFMHRISEENLVKEIIEVGTRAACKEELEYAKKRKIRFITSQHIIRNGYRSVVERIKETIRDYEEIYISVDMDVLDPAFAPAVQNPEPDGLSINTLLDILCEICDRRTIIFDLTEVTPIYDNGVTSIQAARILYEVICKHQSSKRKN